jgi:serine/threonine protein kinase
MQELHSRQVIGEGQHGKVIKCIHRPCSSAGHGDETSSTVAVKVFKTSTLDTHIYCGRELAMMASCQHHSITKVINSLKCVIDSLKPVNDSLQPKRWLHYSTRPGQPRVRIRLDHLQ